MLTKQELINQIIFHRNKYWVDNDPEISDSEYDLLIESLRAIDPDNILLSDVEFNAQISDDKKIHHPVPMLSLEKAFSFESIKTWMKKIARNSEEEFIITPKYDGISARYYANQNILASRGDGEFGEDLTNKFPLLEIESESKTNNKNITGEIVIKINRFATCTLTRKDGRKYASPRNLAAGIMNLKDITDLIGKIKLTFIDHKFIGENVSYKDFTLEKWKDIIQDIEKIKETYPLDGIVFELKDINYSESLGLTAHHPRGKLAYKFEDIFAYSTLESITFQSGKHKLTPVANITPVTINGVTIQRVTLHNAKMLIDNNVHIGDTLKIIRSGDVIPYIAEIIEGAKRSPINIDACPYCDSKLEYREPELYCTNTNCIGTSSKQLYESVKTLGIEGIGPTTIDKFIQYLNVESILDILTLEYEDIVDLPDFGETSADNIINAIDNVVKSVEDYKVLACLNIKSIGTTLSKQILTNYTLDELLEVSAEELSEIPGIGYIRSLDITRELSNSSDLLLELMELLNIRKSKDIQNVSLGTICFSGTFPKQKEYYRDLAIDAKYTVVESVTKNLTYLVSAGAITSKVTKARSYRVPILKLEDFMKLINK